MKNEFHHSSEKPGIFLGFLILTRGMGEETQNKTKQTLKIF
jgi:hypothetical protein